jgi:PAP2 superfamily
MANISLQEWLKVLGEAGVTFSAGSYTREKALKAAERLQLELAEGDLAALHELGEIFCFPIPGSPTFLMNLFRHQQSTLRAQRIPSRRDRTPQPEQQIAVHDPKSLPPWGQVEDSLYLTMILGAVVPIDWMPQDLTEPTRRKWCDWTRTLQADIAKWLWPVFEGGVWHGEAAVGPLLDADFKLLDDLRDNFGLPISSLHPSSVQHCDLFTEEDDLSIDFATGYERYDPTLPPEVLKDLPGIVAAAIADKVSTLDVQLKLVFQRPRPFQVARLQNRSPYSYTWARTGNTPSLPNGHCLQSVIGGCTAYVALAEEELHGKAASIAVLKQFMVDIGDRRVFAGVHYPSDSLASWYVAFQLIPRVFRPLEQVLAARRFLWEALNEKSLVFGAIEAHWAANPESPYGGMMKVIEKLATGP